MHFTQVGVLAALVGVAPAFLLPPAISEADTDIIKTLPFEDAIAMDSRVMEVACPGCPVVTNIEGKMHVTQVDSVLKLNFSLAHDGADQLLLNGVQIYPIDPRADSFGAPLSAKQMIKASDNTWQFAAEPTLGFSVSVKHPATADQEIDLVSVHLEIVEVGDKFLSGIPTVDLQLLQTISGQLMIGNAEITAPKSPSSKPTDDGQECTTLICKWRAIVADRIAQLRQGKGCGGKKPTVAVEAKPEGHHGGHHEGGHREGGHHGKGPRPHHRPHPHHSKHRGFAKFFRGVIVHIFIPVLIGILCGITASVVGMVVGHVAIFVWRLLFRRGEQHARYHSICQKDFTVKDENEETKGFLEHQDPPPEYIDAVAGDKLAPADEKTEV